MLISQRAQGIEESVTLAVTARAKALREAGQPVIGFGAGEPDFPTPAHIVEAAQEACADPANHHYSPAAGLPMLRSAIAQKTARDSGYPVEPEQVVVTNGGKHALYEVFQALLDPGDEVLLPAPYWVSYPEQIRLAAARPVVIPTDAASGYRVTVDQLEAATSERTRALVFVSPSNPTGVVYGPDQVEAIGRWALGRGVTVVTDEIYEHLVYGGATFTSMPAVVPELSDRCVVVNGVAKTYAMTGWRVGWAIAPRELIRAVTRIQSHLSSNVDNVAQRAALAALMGPQDSVARMRTAFDRRRQLTVERLAEIPDLTCPEPEGAFYAFPDCTAALGRTVGDRTVTTTIELADALLETAQVAVVPGEAFGAPGCIRLSYAMGDDDLEEGLDRLAKALAS